jgi:hypothetical protein
MPRLTRDQQFQKSFKEFFDNRICTYYPIQEYSIQSITENKNLSEQQYVLHIPRNIVDYHIDVFTVNSDGTVHPPGPIMKKQYVPSCYDLIERFENHFEQYKLQNQLRTLSFVNVSDYFYEKDDIIVPSDIIDTELQENGEPESIFYHYDLKFRFLVVYHKSHLPFPVPLTTKDQFEQQCKKLEDRNIELCINLKTITNMYQEKEEQYDVLRRKIRVDRRNLETKYRTLFDKMQKKFAEYYSLMDSKDDCPVCYETIEASKLKVPGCCHTICTDCSSRCNSCPICRESY